MKEILARTEEELGREGIQCSTLVDEGNSADVLVRLAEECAADVLVIGNKGIRRRVLGSVPNSVTHNAPCSVFVVKPLSLFVWTPYNGSRFSTGGIPVQPSISGVRARPPGPGKKEATQSRRNMRRSSQQQSAEQPK